MPELIYAFSGSRTFTDEALVRRIMRRLLARRTDIAHVRVGDAKRGLDTMIPAASLEWGVWPWVEVCHWPPNPSTRQQRWIAAHDRNDRVVLGSEEHPGKADMLIALFAPGPLTPGTLDAVTTARETGVTTHVYHEGKWTTSPPSSLASSSAL